jgi:peptide/nickel transport system substrate-binding protein
MAPWSDVHVRRAVAYALDRAAIIKGYGAAAVPNTTFIPRDQLLSIGTPKQIDALRSSVPQYPYDVAKAKAELAKSAYPNGVNVTLETFAGAYANATQVIADEMTKAGINAKVTSVTSAKWFADISGPAANRPPTLITSGCNTPDPSFYPNFILGAKNLASGSFNVSDYAPPEVDALMTAGVATDNAAKRRVVYKRFLQKVQADVPYVPLFELTANIAISPKYTWKTFNGEWWDRAWALEIKPA